MYVGVSGWKCTEDETISAVTSATKEKCQDQLGWLEEEINVFNPIKGWLSLKSL